jgi:hypothetical protein
MWSVTYAYVRSIAGNHHCQLAAGDPGLLTQKRGPLLSPHSPIAPGKHSVSLEFRPTEATSGHAPCLAATPRTKVSKPAAGSLQKPFRRTLAASTPP